MGRKVRSSTLVQSDVGLVLGDLLVLSIALPMMLSLRYLDQASHIPWTDAVIAVALEAVLHLGLARAMGLYRGRYRTGSKEESVALALHMGILTIVFLAVSILWPTGRLVPISTCASSGLVALLGMVGIRVFARNQAETQNRPAAATRALVFGCGVAGAQLVDSMLGDPSSPYQPVGLLDDDETKHNLKLRGLRCYGGVDALADAAIATSAEVLVLAVVSGPPDFYQRVSREAARAGMEVKILPPLQKVLSHGVAIRDLADISVVDLLGRREIQTNLEQIGQLLRGQRVLVTGAGGSIGSELCRQLSKFPTAELMMLDRDESALHALQLSISGRALLDSRDVILADIRDLEAMREIFERRRPDIVFHAAALKHLPMLEQYPDEAWKTNVLGTANVLDAAQHVRVAVFVNISTDKAANVSSNLGRSKRIAEQMTAAVSPSEGRYLSVRFGNVLGSRGSVLLSFSEQISRGGPVTVTHPDVTRFFMTIAEAVELTLQASAIGQSGQTLVLDMGSPVKILDVARQMIVLSKRHVDVEFSGLRGGEKLHEDLFDDSELSEPTPHNLINSVAVPGLSASEVRQLDSQALRTLTQPTIAAQRSQPSV